MLARWHQIDKCLRSRYRKELSGFPILQKISQRSSKNKLSFSVRMVSVLHREYCMVQVEDFFIYKKINSPTKKAMNYHK